MTRLDRFLQKWSIRKAARFIPPNARVLDVGCSDGALFEQLKCLRDGVGIDPDLKTRLHLENAKLFPGYFPADLPESGPFDAITMLAVLEHVPERQQITLARDCFDHLRDGGRLIITVPSPQVDNVLSALRMPRLVDGMHVEQHYGYDAKQTPALFQSAGFTLLHSMRFQIGLNNLFVFQKPGPHDM